MMNEHTNLEKSIITYRELVDELIKLQSCPPMYILETFTSNMYQYASVVYYRDIIGISSDEHSEESWE